MSAKPCRRWPSRTTAFTLIEILIVVVILGILAMVVISLFRTTTDDAMRTAFVTSARSYCEAAVRYRLDTHEYLENAASGVMPAGFATYIRTADWGHTPLGGVWDTELNTFGVTSALGVHFNGTGQTRDDVYMQEVDARFDDGDLTTGGFRKLDADRYYFVLAD
jgi:prepilin-type N-terminal cleavage/methylation domain-containing protein